MNGLTVGTVTVNPAIDVGIVVDRLLVDHKMVARRHRRDPGGGGVNVARSLVRLGVPARAVVTTGGPTGAELRALLAREDVATVPLPIAGATRESVSIRDASDGHQYRVVMPGPSIDDLGDVAGAVVAAVEGCDVVVLSGRLNPGLDPAVYRVIAERLSGSVVVVDASAAALAATVRGWCSLVKPSRRELLSVVGLDPDVEVDEVEVAREVLALGGVDALLVSLGGDGALLVPRVGEVWRYEVPPIERVVSTVGCGDATVAGVVAGVASGRPMIDAVRLGVACGTAAALTPGTELFDPAVALALERGVVSDSIG